MITLFWYELDIIIKGKIHEINFKACHDNDAISKAHIKVLKHEDRYHSEVQAWELKKDDEIVTSRIYLSILDEI